MSCFGQREQVRGRSDVSEKKTMNLGGCEGDC
jgi:hypothetical protein